MSGKIKMLAPFKKLKVNQVVTPEDSLADWLVSRQYAVRVNPEDAPAKKRGGKKAAAKSAPVEVPAANEENDAVENGKEETAE